ncbi:DUF503 domain-containing protein [bacterium]|nr:MAG: DUF503 domain-containing protein [bacterium]
MPIGILQLTLYSPDIQSLKSKRHFLKPLIHNLQENFHVSVAEVGKQDIWKNSDLLIAIASSDAKQLDIAKQRISDYIELHYPDAYIIKYEMEIIFE